MSDYYKITKTDFESIIIMDSMSIGHQQISEKFDLPLTIVESLCGNQIMRETACIIGKAFLMNEKGEFYRPNLKYVRVNDNMLDEIIERLIAGEDSDVIAASLNISNQVVMAIKQCKQQKFVSRISDDKLQKLAALASDRSSYQIVDHMVPYEDMFVADVYAGFSSVELARKYNYSTDLMRRWLRDEPCKPQCLQKYVFSTYARNDNMSFMDSEILPETSDIIQDPGKFRNQMTYIRELTLNREMYYNMFADMVLSHALSRMEKRD